METTNQTPTYATDETPTFHLENSIISIDIILNKLDRLNVEFQVYRT